MCDLNRYLQQLHNGFVTLFDEAPKALSVRNHGASIWCNAPLQYASKSGVTTSQAAERMLQSAPQADSITSWQVLENGMLQARFTEEAILASAKAFCIPQKKVEVSHSHEPLFFEKCVAIRAQHVLGTPDYDAELSVEDQDILVDILCNFSRKNKLRDIVRTAELLESRLDAALKNKRQYDLVCHVLLCALQAQLAKEIAL